MKNVAIVFILLNLIFITHNTKAQDSIPSRAREFYLSLSDFSPVNISLRYKKQISEKRYLKLGLVSLMANMSSSNNQSSASFPVKNENYSGGLEFGIEFRRVLSRKFSMFHGPSLRGLYQYSMNRNLNPGVPPNQQKNDSHTINGGIVYSLGLLFHLNSNFYLAAEISPSVYLSYQKSGKDVAGSRSSYYNGGIGFDSRSAMISLVYRF